jgi:metal-responsive CopG/Arc/MetJ family transcriptional regulator
MPKQPKAKPRVPRNEERIAVRLPATLLRKVDLLSAESLCPRSLAIRRLLMRGLEVEARRQ